VGNDVRGSIPRLWQWRNSCRYRECTEGMPQRCR
jgi:hypothetical protein